MRLLSNLYVKGKPAMLPDRAICRQSHYFIYRPRILFILTIVIITPKRFDFICIILRELQGRILLQLRSLYFIEISLKIIKLIKLIKFMWLLLIKYSLYDFCNIICISRMFTWPYIQSGHSAINKYNFKIMYELMG